MAIIVPVAVGIMGLLWPSQRVFDDFHHIRVKDTGRDVLQVLTTLSIPPIHAKLNFGLQSLQGSLSIELSLICRLLNAGSCTFARKPSYGRE